MAWDISTVSSWSMKRLKQFVRSNKEWFKPDENGITILEYVIKSENLKLVTHLVNILPPFCDIKIPIHEAVKTGNKKLIKMMLCTYPNNETDLDEYGNVPLYYAVEIGDMEIIKLFTKVDAIYYGEQYNTPFGKAINNNRIDIVKYFMNINPTSYLTYVDIAIANNNKDIIYLLLSPYVKKFKNIELPYFLQSIKEDKYDIVEMLLYEFKSEISPFDILSCKSDKMLTLLVSEYLWTNNYECDDSSIRELDIFKKCKDELNKAKDLINIESIYNIYRYISVMRRFDNLESLFPIYHKKLYQYYNIGLEYIKEVTIITNSLYDTFNKILPLEICEMIVHRLDFTDIYFC
ncbi:ankyrin-like protein/NFkB inhibitor [NY_014 poxvirus]|uniref:ankyrin-like protein/NFkB inhibitor n=1 Tax=NY_014 poxvirus TaxID=2025360 RepID=UPI000B9A0B32|nr:ankyrin-like protein/NFkB inhibitor [NY_014 poxvirus]AST09585.1 ankyrin-like protein/NFkB inhibitor [NY_014 poxvirus]